MSRLAVANCLVFAVLPLLGPSVAHAQAVRGDDPWDEGDVDDADGFDEFDGGVNSAFDPDDDSDSNIDAAQPEPRMEPAPEARQARGTSNLRGLEAAILEETNLLRRAPRAYAQKLRQLRPSYRGKLIHRPGQASILTQEGVAALDEAIAALESAPRSLSRLAHAHGLSRAAADHAKDLGRTGMLGHRGSDGSGPDRRAKRHGTWDGLVAENISFGPTDAEEIVIGLLVDDGVPDRGHRDVLLTRDLFFGGVGCGPHPGYGTTCVMTYATSFRSNPSGKRLADVDDAPGQPPEQPMLRPDDHDQADSPAGNDEPWACPNSRDPAPYSPDRADSRDADADDADDDADDPTWNQPTPSYGPSRPPTYGPPRYQPGSGHYSGPRHQPGPRYHPGPRYPYRRY